MELAFLGATSQIGRDLIVSLSRNLEHNFILYARRTDAVANWLAQVGLCANVTVKSFDQFAGTSDQYDAILNLVGSGNPATTVISGAAIIDTTYRFDNLVLKYLERHPECRYIFFSSGAVYGGDFLDPVGDATWFQTRINDLRPTDWYGLSKLFAECQHRARPDLHIVDLRVFNYVSYSSDLSARFLITDILREIIANKTFRTSGKNIFRDYAGPFQIAKMVEGVLNSAPINIAVDFYTKNPVDKFTLLESMATSFGLKYEVVEDETGINATGLKSNYYSISTRANHYFGYDPQESSLNVVQTQANRILSSCLAN
jgi:nucleoside-diphosphate-sugar epimerase